MDTLPELREFLLQKIGSYAYILGGPRLAAVVTSIYAGGRDAYINAVRIFGIHRNGVQNESSASGSPVFAVSMVVQPGDGSPIRTVILRGEQSCPLNAGVQVPRRAARLERQMPCLSHPALSVARIVQLLAALLPARAKIGAALHHGAKNVAVGCGVNRVVTRVVHHVMNHPAVVGHAAMPVLAIRVAPVEEAALAGAHHQQDITGFWRSLGHLFISLSIQLGNGLSIIPDVGSRLGR